MLAIALAATASLSGLPRLEARATTSAPARRDIPPAYATLYRAAASRFGIPWELLAAVGKVECDHGRGHCYVPNYAGAMGPMQFMPATWPAYARASQAPPFSPYDARDAIFAAAAKLAADGAPTRVRAALFSYNASWDYVDDVLAWAARYRDEERRPLSLAALVLSHPRIGLTPPARADIASGVVDERVLGALLVLARDLDLDVVGPFVSGHSVLVAGTRRVSHHAVGRAVDVSVIGGAPVSRANKSARRALALLVRLRPPLRPHEVGAPWTLTAAGIETFTDDHSDHIHIGYLP